MYFCCGSLKLTIGRLITTTDIFLNFPSSFKGGDKFHDLFMIYYTFMIC